MKVLGKITLILGLMIIVSLFLTSCSGGGLVTPELQLESEEDIDKVEETEEAVEEQATGTEGQTVDELVEELTEEAVEEQTEEEQATEEEVEEVNEEQTEGAEEEAAAEEAVEEEVEEIVETGSVHLNVPYEKYAGANWCLPASSAVQ